MAVEPDLPESPVYDAMEASARSLYALAVAEQAGLSLLSDREERIHDAAITAGVLGALEWLQERGVEVSAFIDEEDESG